MNVLLDRLKPVGPSLPQIEAWVDILDRAEPERAGWRTAFANLKEQLGKARSLRDIPRRPVFAFFVIASTIHSVNTWLSGGPGFLTWSFWLSLVAGTLLLIYFIWEAVLLTRMLTVLALEERVAALLRYYGAKDVPLYDEALSDLA
jgi:hypothetical protein